MYYWDIAEGSLFVKSDLDVCSIDYCTASPFSELCNWY